MEAITRALNNALNQGFEDVVGRGVRVEYVIIADAHSHAACQGECQLCYEPAKQ